MKTLIVTTQAEFDALPSSFPEITEIEIRADKATGIVVRQTPDSSTVTAYGSSTVTACGSSIVTAYDSSTVTACGSSTVTACDSSTVTAYDSSTVTACGFAVAVLWGSAKIRKKGKYAKVVRQRVLKAKTLAEWIDINDVEVKGQFVTLYKRVSVDLKTQEGEANETLWAIGSSLVVPNWDPAGSECGAGKFHGCPAPRYCDEFRTKAGDRYVAIKVAKKDCKVWPDARYPHKIAFRAGTVLHECDKNGKKIG